MPTVLALSGSLRQGSFTTAVLRQALTLAPAGLDITLVDMVRQLPLYDEDLADDGAGDEMRAQVAAADGLLIATPEYNYGMPGPLKNWLDWASRPFKNHCLMGKPVAVFGVSPGPRGGQSAVEYMRTIFPALGARIVGKELLFPAINDHRNVDTGVLEHDVAHPLTELLAELLRSIVSPDA